MAQRLDREWLRTVALSGGLGFQALAVASLPAQDLGSFVFAEVTDEAGLDFVHENGMQGGFHLPEIVGGGGAFLDYDRDGDLDLFLVQSGSLPAGGSPGGGGDRLFRNELVRSGAPEAAALRFTDVTGEVGLEGRGYGMGVASGDVNNDGFPDLYVTRLGSNALLLNRGGGTFEDVTEAAGADDPRWSVSASFFDYDGDGWLDLYVVNYVRYSFAEKRECFASSSARDYCGPDAFDAAPDSLFRNRGDGSFEPVGRRLGSAATFGAGLGVVSADLNGDGWLDLYVANDGDANQLWINEAGQRFRDAAPLSGVALNREGVAEAGMGVDAGDYDGDGDEDLFVTHLTEETDTLYVNQGDLLFEDRTIQARLHVPTLPATGFGTAFLDYDNDGDLDLIALNGAVRIQERLARGGDPYPLGQTNQLFENTGAGTFREVGSRSGPTFALVEVSRGAVVGDVDNDGDPDVAVVNNRGSTRLLLNQRGQERHWIGLRVLARGGQRDALGAWVEVASPGGGTVGRRVRTDGSYASARDPRVLAGLGDSEAPREVRVHWVRGAVEVWSGLAVDRYHTLVEGSGTVEEER